MRGRVVCVCLGIVVALLLPLRAQDGGPATGEKGEQELLDAARTLPFQINGAARNHDGAAVKALLTEKYILSGERFLTAFKDKDPEGACARDFDYYSIVGVRNVMSKDGLIGVTLDVAYDPQKSGWLQSIDNSLNEDDPTMYSRFWNANGGVGYSHGFLREGKGIATYFLISQRGGLKVAHVHLSPRPLTQEEFDRTAGLPR